MNEDEQIQNGISRRKMIETSIGALACATVLGSTGLMAAAAKPEPETPPKNNFSLRGKSAIVTGAARGIGRAIAIALAEAGADIMGIDIAAPASPEVIYPAATKQDLDETGKRVEALKRRFVAIQADTRDITAMRAAAEKAQNEFGKIDIVVADAGIQVYASVLE
ncbi:MAG TPA: SDR family NAD(P)-dependent oxidoreductase, partial [Bacteroidia bacterium]|nr:SDR family NAD(P)-dependent oxidoreductase [Bacteroidia bacterium]